MGPEVRLKSAGRCQGTQRHQGNRCIDAAAGKQSSVTPPSTSNQWKPSTKRHRKSHIRSRLAHSADHQITKLRSFLDASAPHPAIFHHFTDHQISKLRSILGISCRLVDVTTDLT